MTINRTTLLDLPLPVTGTEAGSWGDVTNKGLTEYLDISIAGALSITGSVTLTLTEGTSTATNIGSTTAQYRTLVVPASGVSANVIITAPSSNRTYHVVNLNATYTVQIRAGVNSGITLGVNQSATVTYDSATSDYVLVGTIGPTVPVARGGTGLTSGTSGGVLAFTASGTLASSGVLGANQFVIGGGAGAAPTSTTTISWANVFTAAQTFRAADAIRSEVASTQDAIVVAGRAGGTSSYAVTLTPTTLSANRTVTFPDANINFVTGLSVPNGGTGTNTLTANNVILGNGTAAVQFVAPGASGNVLSSNGTTWVSQAVTGGSAQGFVTQFTGGNQPPASYNPSDSFALI